MNIAVIGGSGFIGTRLVKRLLEAGHQVKILDKNPSEVYESLRVFTDVRKPETMIDGLRGIDVIYNLAAEHRDDVSPVSLYHDVNVQGAQNICDLAIQLGIDKIIFTSSVAVYGSSVIETDESGFLYPENPYGKSKKDGETVYRTWLKGSLDRSLAIIRPTVAFGEDNRGNVYNLLKQIASGTFLMIGRGTNVKSMCYVENVAAFLAYSLIFGKGEHLYNYIDKPDFDMNTLVRAVNRIIGKGDSVGIRLPYVIGLFGGYCFDLLAKILGKKLFISSVRVKKFHQSTRFKSSRIKKLDFQAPVALTDGLNRTIEYEFGRK